MKARLLAPLGVFAAVLLLAAGTASASTIQIASGSLTVSAGELLSGPGGWDSATLTYDVDYNDVTGVYLYSYTLDDLEPEKAISHVITQVSDNFTAADSLPGTTDGGALGTYSGADPSNPGMPASITGIKWNPSGNLLEYSWVIETLRAPMWGNFYAVDGKKPGDEVYTYNSGFALVGTANEPACYKDLFYDFPTCSGFLLVPDTIEGPPPDEPPDVSAPEPASMVLLGTGLVGIAASMRRRFRRQ